MSQLRPQARQSAGRTLPWLRQEQQAHWLPVLTESDRLSRLLSDFMEFSRVELRRWAAVDLSVQLGLDAHVWQLAWCLVTYLDRQGYWHDHT